MDDSILKAWVSLVEHAGFWGAVILIGYSLVLLAAVGFLMRTLAAATLRGIRQHRVRRFMRLHNGGQTIRRRAEGGE